MASRWSWIYAARPSYVSGRLATASIAIKGLRAICWFPLLYGALEKLGASWEMWVGFGITCCASFIIWVLDSVYDVDGNGE